MYIYVYVLYIYIHIFPTSREIKGKCDDQFNLFNLI